MVSGAGVPDAPRPPAVLCRSAHSALVQWEEPFNNGAIISEYRLEWSQKGESSSDADYSQLYTGSACSFEAKGLVPAGNYSFRVQVRDV